MTQRLLFILLPMLWLNVSCKRSDEASEIKARTIVILSAQGDQPYQSVQAQHLLRLIGERPDISLQGHDAGGSAKVQSEQFGKCLESKPFAILVSPVDAASLSEQVAGAVHVGVIVIGLGEKAAAMPCTTVLSCDARELGRQAGEVAVRALTRKAQDEGKTDITGRIVEIRGDESPESTARHEGFTEALKKTPGAVIVHDAPGGWTKQGGKDRAAEALRLQQHFDILYAYNDAMAYGATTALGPQRENVLIIGTDGYIGVEGGLTLVSQGNIDASIYQPILVDLAWKLILRRLQEPNFAPKPSYRLTPVTITPKNVEDLRRGGLSKLPEL